MESKKTKWVEEEMEDIYIEEVRMRKEREEEEEDEKGILGKWDYIERYEKKEKRKRKGRSHRYRETVTEAKCEAESVCNYV